MKRGSKFTAVAAIALAISACAPQTIVEGTLKDAPGAKVVVKKMLVDHYQVLDTVVTGENGEFVYKAEVEKNNPQFLDLYYGDNMIGALLLNSGDKVKVVSDTLGAYTVTGSDACRELQKINNKYMSFMMDFARYKGAAAVGMDVNRDLSKRYIEYYRECVAYVVGNSKSMTVIPVLFQQVDVDFPVFSQATDAILFTNIADSLKQVYPESEYVKALSKEAEKRYSYLELGSKLNNAQEVGFPEIVLPGVDAKPVKLSDIQSKVVMVYFWASTAEQNMFNLDTLIPLYEKYHSKGLEIYAVSLDVDKTAWASVVRNQKQPWVNVCDTRGIASPYIGLWGVQSLPMVFFIVDGDIDPNAMVSRPADLDKYLSGKLK